MHLIRTPDPSPSPRATTWQECYDALIASYLRMPPQPAAETYATTSNRRDAIMVLVGYHQRPCCLFMGVFGPLEADGVLRFLQGFEHGCSDRYHLNPPPSYPWFTFSVLPAMAELAEAARSEVYATATQVALAWAQTRQQRLREN